MAKKSVFENSILCDHVVQGAGNKSTLIGVYSGDIIVPELPARMFFGFYTEHIVGDSEHVEGIDLQIKLDKKILATVMIKYDPVESNPKRTINLPIFEIGVDKNLELEVVALVDGEKPHSILKKRIIQGPI